MTYSRYYKGRKSKPSGGGRRHPKSIAGDFNRYKNKRVDSKPLSALERGQRMYKEIFERTYSEKWIIDDIRAGADLGVTDDAGNTFLMRAAIIGNEKIIQAVLNRLDKATTQGANTAGDVNAQNAHGETALQLAVCGRNHVAAERLLEAGADSDIPDNKGRTAVIDAVSRNDIDMLRLLKRHNANLDIADNDGMTAAMYAVTLRRLDMLKELISLGASLGGQRKKDRANILTLARRSGDAAMFAYVSEIVSAQLRAAIENGVVIEPEKRTRAKARPQPAGTQKPAGKKSGGSSPKNPRPRRP